MIGNKPQILVVEDDELFRILVCSALEAHGYAPLAAGDSSEASALLESTDEIDLLITDSFMPEVDGFEIVQQLKKRGRRIPAIVMSGGSRDMDLLPAASLLGAAGALRKPFTEGQLIAKVREVLGDPPRNS